jgi:hypothetical protein
LRFAKLQGLLKQHEIAHQRKMGRGRIAANIAKLPELLRKPSDASSPYTGSPLLRAMSSQTASLAPEPQSDATVHIVLDDFGKSGRSYRETAEDAADFDTVVDDLIAGQFNNPVRVIAFNVSKAGRGTSRIMLLGKCLAGREIR